MTPSGIEINSLNQFLFIMQKMGVYCEIGSEFVCSSELYRSKSSMFFPKANAHLPPTIRVLRHPSHAAIQRLSSKFPPKEPSKRYPPFFHIAALQTQISAQTLNVFPLLLTQAAVPFPSIFRLQEGTVVTAWRLSNKILRGSFFSHKLTAFIYNSSSSFSPFLFLLQKKSASQTSAKIWT